MKIAKRRSWTDEEIDAAIDHIKNDKPGLWESIVEVERATGDFSEGTAANKLFCSWFASLLRMHPECEGTEIADLLVAMRTKNAALRSDGNGS